MCGRALEAVPHRGNLPTIAFEWPSSRFAESTKLRELRQTFLAQREWTTYSGSLSLAGLCARTVHVDFVCTFRMFVTASLVCSYVHIEHGKQTTPTSGDRPSFCRKLLESSTHARTLHV